MCVCVHVSVSVSNRETAVLLKFCRSWWGKDSEYVCMFAWAALYDLAEVSGERNRCSCSGARQN